jgi:hypothetical protein
MKKIKSATLLAGWQWEMGGVVRKTRNNIPLSQHIPSGDWADPYTSSAVNFTFTPTFIENNKDYFKVEYEPEEPRFRFATSYDGNVLSYSLDDLERENKTEFNRFVQWCRETAGDTIRNKYDWYVGCDEKNKRLYYNNHSEGIITGGITFYGTASVHLFISELTRPENRSWYDWYIKQLEKVDL